jgi:hypothetical protein
MTYDGRVEYPEVPIHMQVRKGFEGTHMLVSAPGYAPAIAVCRLLAAKHLAEFRVVTGEVDEYPEVHSFRTDCVQAVNDEQLDFAEVGEELVDLLGDDVDAGNGYAFPFTEVLDVSVQLLPVVFLNPYQFEVALYAVLPPQERMDVVVVVGMEDLDPYAPAFEEESKGVREFGLSGTRFSRYGYNELLFGLFFPEEFTIQQHPLKNGACRRFVLIVDQQYISQHG